MENELIAYCGVNCGDCPDYMSEKCPGCRNTEWEPGDECMPVSCCAEKSIDCCGECAGFPCEEMKEFYEESDSHKAALRRMQTAWAGNRPFDGIVNAIE